MRTLLIVAVLLASTAQAQQQPATYESVKATLVRVLEVYKELDVKAKQADQVNVIAQTLAKVHNDVNALQKEAEQCLAAERKRKESEKEKVRVSEQESG